MEEHYIFRRGSFSTGYNLDAYNSPELLPKGFAALAATCFGAMGAVLGMSQKWYVGPIGALCGAAPFGAFPLLLLCHSLLTLLSRR